MQEQYEKNLATIHEMIANTKYNLQKDSFFYLLWGWLALSAALLEAAMMEFTSTPYHWVTWPVLMTLGGIASGIRGKKLGKEQRYMTLLDRIMAFVWIGIVVAILMCLTMSYRIGWEASYTLVIVMYGLGTFISGGALKFRPLIYGGISAWVLALVGAFGQSVLNMKGYLLLLALSLVVSYLIPGYMLKNYKEA